MRRAAIIVPILAIGAAALAQPIGSLISGSASQSAPGVQGAVEWRIQPVTQAGLATKLAEARRYLVGHRGAALTLLLPAGTFDLSRLDDGAEASIDVSGVDACPGRLILSGAGAARTTLIKNDDLIGILGRNTSCLTIENLTLEQRRLEVSQGKVVAVAPDQVTIDIPRGFPSIADLTQIPAARDAEGRARYWLKRYRMTATGPQLISGEKAVRWTTAAPVAGRDGRWTIATRPRPGASEIAIGDWVGIKAKSGGQAYRFIGGHDITFDHVRWLGDARGKFRDVNGVTVRNSTIAKPAPIGGVPFLMATSGGGPQIGHTTDPVTTGHLVENNVFPRHGGRPDRARQRQRHRPQQPG